MASRLQPLVAAGLGDDLVGPELGFLSRTPGRRLRYCAERDTRAVAVQSSPARLRAAGTAGANGDRPTLGHQGTGTSEAKFLAHLGLVRPMWTGQNARGDNVFSLPGP